MGILYQVISTGILCAMGVNMGFIMVWPACTIMMFGSNETTLNRPMTQNEISLLGSLSPIGGMLSTLIAGFMLDKLGRKKCSIAIGVAITIIWASLAICRQVEVVLTCVFFSGIGSSIFLIGMVYISEICQESIRGSMTATNMVSYGIGMLLLYLLGGCLAYDVLLYVGVSMAVGCTALLFVLRDSPVYLMKIGKEEEATQAIAFFRQMKAHDKEVIEEVNNIKSSLNPELDETTPESEKLNPDFKPQNEKLSFWQFMKKSKSTRRALVVIMVVLTSSIFQGLSVVQIYVESLFTAAIPSMPPMLCSVVMAAIIVISGIVSAYLTDMAGRRPLMIYGSIGTGVCCVILGTQMQLQWGPTWITAVLLYMYPVVFTIGAGTVPMVLFAEVFLPEVKSILSMMSVEWTMLCYAISLYIFNPLLGAIGWGPVFYIFAIMSFLTATFSVFFLPETKGLTVEEIQPLFLSKKERNHC